MSDTAMIPDSQGQRSTPWGIGGVIIAGCRGLQVLGLMAEGRSNAAIGQRLFVTERAVATHTASIFLKLGLQPSDDDNRRVLAVLAFLGR